MTEYNAVCANARARITEMRFAPFGVSIIRALPIKPDLTIDDFWNTFDLMQQDIQIAGHNTTVCLNKAIDYVLAKQTLKLASEKSAQNKEASQPPPAS